MKRTVALVLAATVILAGCGQFQAPATELSASPEPRSAALTLALKAPKGVTPNVTITGPDQFTTTISKPGRITLDKLPAGTYSWTAHAVTSDDYTFTATSGQVNLKASDNKDAGVTYDAIDGVLSLTVKAPANVTPKLTLTGPDRFTRVLDGAGAHTLKNLQAGGYNVKHHIIAKDGYEYTPQIGETLVVTTAKTTRGTVTYHAVDVQSPGSVTLSSSGHVITSATSVTLQAYAEDNSAVKTFALYRDGVFVRAESAARSGQGYQARFTVRIGTPGAHRFTVHASDGVTPPTASAPIPVFARFDDAPSKDRVSTTDRLTRGAR